VIRLLEDDTKAWLRDAGFRVASGATAVGADDARRLASEIGTPVYVKALIPAGRRGKAEAVRRADSPEEVATIASELIGRTVSGHAVREVYVERAVDIVGELYCALLFDDNGPRMLVSAHGGVEVEGSTASQSAHMCSLAVDPLRGVTPWGAIELWREAGLRGSVVRVLGELTARLYRLFVAEDAEMLEINPLAIDRVGDPVLVGAMAGIDDAALPRRARWHAAAHRARAFAPLSLREARVARLDAEIAGPEARYVELDGDIGLLVGGGGAGLYQQDRLRAGGGRPANHSVTPPTGSDTRKLRAVIEAILDHPGIRALLVGFNFAQMARADVRVATLMDVVEERGIDTARFPIVIRLFGAGEDEARERAANRPGIHYLPRGASLDDAVRLVIRLASEARTAALA
jgi:succinyl-CoA synthetase beta subunit/citryl-CoA synthetase large subunit